MGHHTYKRSLRINDLLQRELADLLMREAKDPRVAEVTITAVTVSDDIHGAEIYFGMLQGAEPTEKKQTTEVLNRMVPFLRGRLGKRLRIKKVPNLKFHYDNTLDYGDHINRLLHNIEEG